MLFIIQSGIPKLWVKDLFETILKSSTFSNVTHLRVSTQRRVDGERWLEYVSSCQSSPLFFQAFFDWQFATNIVLILTANPSFLHIGYKMKQQHVLAYITSRTECHSCSNHVPCKEDGDCLCCGVLIFLARNAVVTLLIKGQELYPL